MPFKEWKLWFKESHWTTKWFVILILLRPLIDNFYRLKEVSPFLSPLNIAGVLTPILIFFSIFSKGVKRKHSSTSANLFFVYGIMVLANWGIIDILFPYIDYIGDSIKAVTPALLLLYLLYVVRSQRDLHGFLTSFLYSGIYLFGLLVYEFIFGSISGIRVTEGRGGGERFVGFYNDMMNYAIYITGALIIAGYFFLVNLSQVKRSKNATVKFFVILLICVMGLTGIKHVSTWGVCAVIFLILAYYTIRNAKGFFALFFVTVICALIFGPGMYEEQIEPLINKEINVASGENEVGGALNGRVGRWEKYFDIWIKEMPWYCRFVGTSFSGHRKAPVMCSEGMHNDYIRNLFTVGIVGLSFFFLFLFALLYRATYFKIPERFLIMSSVAALMLHSVTTVPLTYSSYVYLLFIVFSFALLPIRQAYAAQVLRKVKKEARPESQIITRIPQYGGQRA